MPRIQYTEYKPNKESLKLIIICDDILEDYAKQGYRLTLRQLYYQLVARDHIPNNIRSYTKLGDIISKAREGGMLDWNHIVDRTRNVKSRPHWKNPTDFMQSVADQFCLDLWEGQNIRPLVFVEKEALEEVVGMAAEKHDVQYFANKGYLSASACWNIAHNQMLKNPEQEYVIIHLGDHDPSGIDMSRDILKRFELFASPTNLEQKRPKIRVMRVALNMDQIEEHDPPPNPAKAKDPRFKEYEDAFGESSWELDALEPKIISKLVEDTIVQLISNKKLMKERHKLEQEYRQRLSEVVV